jgi:histidinol-phosphate phosphatase family protein
MNQSAAPRRVALIDRDGTIIVDKVHLRDPDGIEFAPGAIEGLRLLRDAGFALVLITNQSGIARGYFDAARLEQIHGRLQSMLAAEGLRLEAIYVCPHGPHDGCDCRKPAPGMVKSAMRDMGFGPERVAGRGWRAPAIPPQSAPQPISSKPPGAPASCWLSGRADARGAGDWRAVRASRPIIAGPASPRTRRCRQA